MKRFLSILLVLTMMAGFMAMPVSAESEEETVNLCTKVVFSEDFEGGSVTDSFSLTQSNAGYFSITNSQLETDGVFDFVLPTSGNGVSGIAKSKSSFGGKSITQMTVNLSQIPDHGRIILGMIDDKYLAVAINGYTDNGTTNRGGWYVALDSSYTTAVTALATLGKTTYNLGVNTDITLKAIATGDSVVVYVNDIKAYTYAESDASSFVAMPGVGALTNYFNSGHIYLDDITIKAEPEEEDFYTVSVFNDGTSDGVDNVMTIDKWEKCENTTYNTSGVVDGLLVPGGDAGYTKYGLTPNVTLPSDYVADATGIIAGSYHTDAAIRLKTVGNTSYYFVSMRNGAATDYRYYGIATSFVNTTLTADMTWLAGPATVAFSTAGESAEWKFVVIGDTIKVYRNGGVMLTYTNEELATGTNSFAPVFRLNGDGSTSTRSGTVKLSSVNILRRQTPDDVAEYEITGIPSSGTLTNTETRRIVITADTENLASNIKNTISLKANGTEVQGVFLNPDSKTISINVNKLASDTSYTLSFVPGYKYGSEVKTYTFTTGTIAEVTNVAQDAVVTSNSEKTQYIYELDISYDLTEVTVSGAEGAEVKLTRDSSLSAEAMTSLGTVTDGVAMEISGDKIGRYKYIVIESDTAIETAPEVSASASNDGVDWLKQRPLGGGNVEMSFASFSDLHNLSQTSGSNEKLNAVMSGFDAMSENIDAMTLVGDIVYWNPQTTQDDESTTDVDEEIEVMKSRYKVLSDALNDYGFNNKQNDKTDGKASLWVIGNHEYAEPHTDTTTRQEKTDTIVEECIGYYDNHIEVNGVHLIGAASNISNQFTAEKAQWILEKVEEAEAEDPNKPIFIFTHMKVPGIVYQNESGLDKSNYWSAAGAELMALKEKKQVIFVSGHEHVAAQLPTNIGQDGFTQVMLGVTGVGNLNKSYGTTNMSSSVISENQYHAQGIIAEIKDNVTYIYRIDLEDQAVIGEPWVIDAEGRVDGTEADIYGADRAERANAPYFEDGAESEITVTKSGSNLVITFPQAKVDPTSDDGFTAAYEIHAKYKDTDLTAYSDISDFYLMNNSNTEMSESITMTIAAPEILASHDITLEIYAVSPYLIYSEPIIKTVSATNENILSDEELAKPLPDADILSADFYKGTSEETHGNIEPTVTGSERFIKLSNDSNYIFFEGKSYLDYALTDTPESGYSIETVFNMPANQRKTPSGTVTHYLAGNAAHNLAVDESSNLVFTYTVGGAVQTLKCKVPNNIWLNAVATLSDTEAKLYLDGAVVAEADITGVADSFGGNAYIGKDYFGSMLMGRVYGKALSIGEVYKLMERSDKILAGTSKEEYVGILSQGADVSLLSGTKDSACGEADVLVDGIVSGATHNGGSLIYLSSVNGEFEIDLGREYDLDAFVLYFASNYVNHRTNITVYGSTEKADTDTSKRVALSTVLGTTDSGTGATGANGYDAAGIPVYVSVPPDSEPIRYLYVTRTTDAEMFTVQLGWIINEFQAFGHQATSEEASRIDSVSFTDGIVSAVDVVSDTNSSETGTIIVASYDSDGNLYGVAKILKDVTLNRDGEVQTVSIGDCPAIPHGGTQKVMIWSNMDDLAPLVKKYTILE